jgi:hypothetical protein
VTVLWHVKPFIGNNRETTIKQLLLSDGSENCVFPRRETIVEEMLLSEPVRSFNQIAKCWGAVAVSSCSNKLAAEAWGQFRNHTVRGMFAVGSR